MTNQNNFPEEYGVYIIYNNDNDEVLYIGKSGTLKNAYDIDLNNGNPTSFSIGKQTLNKRIQAKHNKKMKRIDFYKSIMNRDKICKLRFHYYITLFKSGSLIEYPFLAESKLISGYILQYGKLPIWNKTV